MDVDDSHLIGDNVQPRAESEQPTHMSIAIHLFNLAQLNSEIKYVLHSVSHETPRYTYPSIPDIKEWQNDMIHRLRQWASQIPQFGDDQDHLTKICEVKYHEVMMLVLRPTPAIPTPSEESLRLCYNSAVRCVKLFNELYKGDLLQFSWITMHSVFLSMITLLYCLWIVPRITNEIKFDDLIGDLKAGSNVLSAIGEHWLEAKRGRDHLEHLSAATVRWIMECRAHSEVNAYNSDLAAVRPVTAANGRRTGLDEGATELEHPRPGFTNGDQQSLTTLAPVIGSIGPYINPDLFASFLGGSNTANPGEWGDSIDVDGIIQSLFNEFAPVFNTGFEWLEQ
jgi:hypothetical protein